DLANGGAGEDDRVGVDDALEGGGLAAAPDGVGLVAAVGEAGGEVLGELRVRKPVRIAHGGVHGDADRERAAGYKIVDHRGDDVDADVAVIGLAGQLEHGVGDEVFGAEALLDVGEVGVGGLDQVGRLAADVCGLGEAVEG